MASTFLLTVLAWIFFRSESIDKALSYIEGIVMKSSIFVMPNINGISDVFKTIIFISFFLIVEWIGRHEQCALQKVIRLNYFWRRASYVVLVLVIFTAGSDKTATFIYFQF